ncbi:MAG: ABC transporter permease [Desulfobacterales bacterium]
MVELEPTMKTGSIKGHEGKIARWVRYVTDHDVFYSFTRSPMTILASFVTVVILFTSVFAPWLTPHDPFNPASLDLMDAFTPPAWLEDGTWKYPLGTDDQGRDILSTIMFGNRISLIVGFFAVLLSMFIGVVLGTVSGYVGGWFDAVIMRLADAQLTVPPILIALLVDGVARTTLPRQLQEDMAIYVLIFSIGIAAWPQYARVTRSGAMVEKNKEYIAAARVIGIHPAKIMLGHIVPNVMGPTLVMATIGVALAIIIEATLSFLGVGVPPTTPALGTLIRIGNDFLFSGEWWITIFPVTALVVLVLAVNLIGDWLRDTFNPKLR